MDVAAFPARPQTLELPVGLGTLPRPVLEPVAARTAREGPFRELPDAGDFFPDLHDALLPVFHGFSLPSR